MEQERYREVARKMTNRELVDQINWLTAAAASDSEYIRQLGETQKEVVYVELLRRLEK